MSDQYWPGRVADSSAVERVLARVDAKPSATGWMARCPAHDDHSPSLSITEGSDGRVLVYCFAGCSLKAILGGLGLRVADLFPDGHRHARRRPLLPVKRSDFAGKAAHVANVLYALEQLGERWQLMRACRCPSCGCPQGWLRASPEHVDFDCDGGCDSSNLVQALLAATARKGNDD